MKSVRACRVTPSKINRKKRNSKTKTKVSEAAPVDVL